MWGRSEVNSVLGADGERFRLALIGTLAGDGTWVCKYLRSRRDRA